MNEDFLHYLWKYRYFKNKHFKTNTGETLRILQTGIYNRDAGPDFLNARIQIGNTTWAGHIEIHKVASDWYAHKHQNDPAYQNVVLHVVFENDRPVFDGNGMQLCTFELKPYIIPEVLERYERLMLSPDSVACSSLYDIKYDINVSMWLSRLAVERLELRSHVIQKLLDETNSDWETSSFRFLSSFYGMKTNNEAFYQLIQSIPLKAILKQRNSILQIESLLFGQAALLPKSSKDPYVIKLKSEYSFLKTKYNLKPMQKVVWKFARLRPANFPTLRIAQYAAVLHKHPTLLSSILSCQNIDHLYSIFVCRISDYWISHYHFNKETAKTSHRSGKSFLDNLLINACVPLIFYYGKMHQKHELVNRALSLMEQVKAEQNRITRIWKTINIIPKNASESQALLQLKTFYCDKYRCLECVIGNRVLQKSN